MSPMASQITGVLLFAQRFVQAQIKQNINAPRHWPLWGESNSDRLVDFRHKWPVTLEMFPVDDVIMSRHKY